MEQVPMRQVARVKVALSPDIAERLDQAGIQINAETAAHGLPQESFIAEVDAGGDVEALQLCAVPWTRGAKFPRTCSAAAGRWRYRPTSGQALIARCYTE